MEQKRKIDLHFIIKQSRHLICFLVVVIFVFCYSISSFATVNSSSSATIASYFSVSTPSNMPILTYDNIELYYQNNGGDMSNVRGLWSGFYRMNSNNVTYMTTVWNDFVDNLSIPLDISKDGTTYDLSNARWMFFPVSTWNDRMYAVAIIGNGNISIVNGYLVSNAPFTFFRLYYISNAWDWGNSNIYQVSSVSNNGLYCYDMTTFYNAEAASGFFFTDLPIYAGSADGVTGYTNFSTDSTDFDFSNVNYDFNFLRTGNFIISPGEPLPEPEPESSFQGQFYNYAGVNGYFQGLNNNGVLWISNFSFNEYMRLHPEEYKVKIHYSGNIDKADTNIDVPVTYDYSEYIPLSYVIGNGSSYRLTREVLFTNFTAVSDSSVTLADGFKSITTQATGISSQNYTTFNFWTFEGTEYSNNPSFGLNHSLTNIVRQVYINAEVSIIWDPENDGQDETISGVYRKRIGLLDGTEQVMENNISNNYNPPSENNPQYPAQLKDSQGNIVVGAGGTNLSVNPVVYNNLNAAVEYLFNIDTSDYLNIVGNTHSAIQETFNMLTNTSQNGAWAIIERSYDLIPDEIWDWIKSAVAVILGGTIISWAMYFRIKKG